MKGDKTESDVCIKTIVKSDTTTKGQNTSMRDRKQVARKPIRRASEREDDTMQESVSRKDMTYNLSRTDSRFELETKP